MSVKPVGRTYFLRTGKGGSGSSSWVNQESCSFPTVFLIAVLLPNPILHFSCQLLFKCVNHLPVKSIKIKIFWSHGLQISASSEFCVPFQTVSFCSPYHSQNPINGSYLSVTSTFQMFSLRKVLDLLFLLPGMLFLQIISSSLLFA